MSARGLFRFILTLSLCAVPVSASTIDFENISVGTVFGFPNDLPGDVVITTVDGIEVSVQELLVNNNPVPFPSGAQATVGGEFDLFFPTTPLSMNNIALLFDFSNADFDVDFVSLEFQEFGGVSNFAVNGIVNEYPLIDGSGGLSLIPPNVAPGVTAVVNEDTIILMGSIDSFLIGGQELGIDNVIVVPEPLALTLLAIGAGAAGFRRRTRLH
jgi:hypothetical protein